MSSSLPINPRNSRRPGKPSFTPIENHLHHFFTDFYYAVGKQKLADLIGKFEWR